MYACGCARACVNFSLLFCVVVVVVVVVVWGRGGGAGAAGVGSIVDMLFL